jgi:spore maturation protein CgeB
MRTPESLACKRLLLTEDVPAVRDHFEDGKHLVLFKTIDEAVDKAKYYLAHPEDRERIAEIGYKEFLDKHTYMHRTKHILKTCLNWVPEEDRELVTV